MSTILEGLTPKIAANFLRLLIFIIFFTIWLVSSKNSLGVLLLLILLIMALSRWRFNLPDYSIVLDQIICFIFIWFYDALEFEFILVLMIFEVSLRAKLWLLLPSILFILLFANTDLHMMSYHFLSFIIGLIIYRWKVMIKSNLVNIDDYRHELYELKKLKEELLFSNAQGIRYAELFERNRIASQLHDDVGHELTASVLALQAYEHLLKQNDPQAKNMFEQLKQRIDNSTKYLRQTVHNMKPLKDFGIDELENLCNAFKVSPVEFKVYGDTSRIYTYLWPILHTCLKESLTNTLKHSKASIIKVRLDITLHIIRFSIFNDNVVDNNSDSGIGLRNLKERAKAVGGSLFITKNENFNLVCVLPLKEGDNNENLNS